MRTIPLRTPSPDAASDAALRRMHLEDQRQTTARHLQRLHWSRERLADERRRRLVKLVSLAQERSPWHRRRLAGIDPAAVHEARLSELPVMTKEDVMANFDDLVTDPRLTLARVERHLASLNGEPRYLLDRYHTVVSGGSSGVRGVFVYDWPGWATCYAGAFRYLARDFGGRPLSMAVVAAGSVAHISRAILHTFSDPSVIRIHPLPITLPTAEIVAGLNQVQPDTLFIYPSGLVELIEAAQSGELTIAPRAIITGGEPLPAEVRRSAESLFGAKVLNWWLSTEAGPMGIGCGHGPSMHLSDDLMIVEPMDDNGQAVPPGVRSSKVLLTVLYNHALPLIRYELTDEVTLVDGTCPCGSVHTLVEDVQGRRDESFSYGEVSIHPHAFRSVLARESGIFEYRVIQTPAGARVEIRGEADFEALRRRLSEALSARGLNAPEILIATTRGFERQPTGKIKRFVPLSAADAIGAP